MELWKLLKKALWSFLYNSIIYLQISYPLVFAGGILIYDSMLYLNLVEPLDYTLDDMRNISVSLFVDESYYFCLAFLGIVTVLYVAYKIVKKSRVTSKNGEKAGRGRNSQKVVKSRTIGKNPVGEESICGPQKEARKQSKLERIDLNKSQNRDEDLVEDWERELEELDSLIQNNDGQIDKHFANDPDFLDLQSSQLKGHSALEGQHFESKTESTEGKDGLNDLLEESDISISAKKSYSMESISWLQSSPSFARSSYAQQLNERILKNFSEHYEKTHANNLQTEAASCKDFFNSDQRNTSEDLRSFNESLSHPTCSRFLSLANERLKESTFILPKLAASDINQTNFEEPELSLILGERGRPSVLHCVETPKIDWQANFEWMEDNTNSSSSCTDLSQISLSSILSSLSLSEDIQQEPNILPTVRGNLSSHSIDLIQLYEQQPNEESTNSRRLLFDLENSKNASKGGSYGRMATTQDEFLAQYRDMNTLDTSSRRNRYIKIAPEDSNVVDEASVTDCLDQNKDLENPLSKGSVPFKLCVNLKEPNPRDTSVKSSHRKSPRKSFKGISGVKIEKKKFLQDIQKSGYETSAPASLPSPSSNLKADIKKKSTP